MHSISNVVPLFGGLTEILTGLFRVLFNTATIQKHHAQVILGGRKSLFGGLAVPFTSRDFIFFDTMTIRIHYS